MDGTLEHMEKSDRVKSVFNKYAARYNESRRRLIPCFDDFYKVTVEIIPFRPVAAIKVLDHGAGTGLLSAFVAAAFPNSDITLVDISENMMNQARISLSQFPNRFHFRVSDYSELQLQSAFDLIMSGLSIHHLPDPKKRDLFSRVFDHLSMGGIFINADQFKGETPEIDLKYRETWLRQAKENGTTESELAAAFERMKEDKMATLNEQLQWMRDSGFKDVNCWYQHYSFAVFSGEKPHN